ncbi:MAG TPA: gliding motility-associated ABC transporter ATP-binding subunit GldA [Lutibacter sp.]|nr:gliding motility-associated ABC transporter ATP-binding subunit GldA [Lutibacter sp.]
MSIQVQNLSKTYNNQKAVDNISFSIEKGEIVGFLGPNGAGKSTLMKILSGFITDFEGEALINDQDVRLFPIETKKNIGYLPEHNPLYTDMYVKEYLAFHASIYKIPKQRIQDIIEEVGLQTHASKKIKELSKGYRQRVGLAAALLHKPDVLILDEPTTGLDPNQLVEIRELIKRSGKQKTVLFSTHIMQEVEAVCDRVIIINKGQLVADQYLKDLQASATQVIAVEFDKNIDKELIASLPNIKTTNQINDTSWELSFNGTEDQRATIFDFAQNNGIKILSLSQKTKNLEELFRELTK